MINRYLICLGGTAWLLSGLAGAADPEPPRLELSRPELSRPELSKPELSKPIQDAPPQQTPQTQPSAPLSLAERVARIEAVLQNHAALSLLKEVEAMKTELSRLRGKDETQDHQLESLGKRQSDLYVDLDKRVDDLGKQPKTSSQQPVVQPVMPVVAVAPVATPLASVRPTISQAETATGQTRSEPRKPEPPKPEKPADSPEDPLAESRSYETALNLFRAGNHAGAIVGFRNFLKAYPDSTLASNAQYWVGFAYYALKDYKNSLEQQKKLVSDWPQSSKIPEALLNIANSQVELGDLASAKKNLGEIVSKYPGTNAAAIATRRLALLK